MTGSSAHLTTEEYGKLIHMATRERCISATFGPGHVTVDLSLPENKWMIEPLALMRRDAAHLREVENIHASGYLYSDAH